MKRWSNKARREVDAHHQGRGRARRVRDRRSRPAPRAYQAARPPEIPHELRPERPATTPSRSAHIAGLMAAELGVGRDAGQARRSAARHRQGRRPRDGGHATSQLGVEFLPASTRKSDDVIHAIRGAPRRRGAADHRCLPRAGGRRDLRRPPRRPPREPRELHQASREARGADRQLSPASTRPMPFRPAARSASWSSPSRSARTNMVILARELAKKIEDELEYPGQIKVQRPARDERHRIREIRKRLRQWRSLFCMPFLRF